MLLKNLIDLPQNQPAKPRLTSSKLESEQSTTENLTKLQSDQVVTSSNIPVDYLADAIYAHDNTYKAKRLADDYIHVSSLCGSCPRQYALMVKRGEPILERIGTATQVVWALGRAAENHIRASFIGSRNYEGILGRWHCRCGAEEYEGHFDDGLHCSKCGTPPDRYGELVLIDPEHYVIGSPDLVFEYNGLYYVVEVKSVKGGSSANQHQGFDDLTRPTGNHIFQARMYRHLLKVNGFPVADEIIVIYVNKQYTFGKDKVFKEFHVDVSGPEDEAAVQKSLLDAKAIFDYLKNGGPLPERTLCTALDSHLAKKCPVAGRCFSE